MFISRKLAAALTGGALTLTLTGAFLPGPATAVAAETDPDTTAASGSVQETTRTVLYGTVYGPDGDLWDNVSVQATRLDASTPAASALTYGGEYELRVPAGSYRISFHDLSDRVSDQIRPAVVEVTDRSPGSLSLGDTYLTYGPARNTTRPTIVGAARVGATLRADAGTWKPTQGLDFTYRWTVAGTTHTGPALKLTRTTVGKIVRLTVTGQSRAWSPTTVAAGNAVTVTKARTTLNAFGPQRAVRRTANAAIVVRVTDPSTVSPAGTVTVTERGRLVGQARIGAGDRGRGLVRLTRLGVGRHTLTVTWSGTPYATGASDTVVVTVRR